MIFSSHDTLRFGDQVSQSVKKMDCLFSLFFFNFYNMIFYGSHLYVDVPEKGKPRILYKDLFPGLTDSII